MRFPYFHFSFFFLSSLCRCFLLPMAYIHSDWGYVSYVCYRKASIFLMWFYNSLIPERGMTQESKHHIIHITSGRWWSTPGPYERMDKPKSHYSDVPLGGGVYSVPPLKIEHIFKKKIVWNDSFVFGDQVGHHVFWITLPFTPLYLAHHFTSS